MSSRRPRAAEGIEIRHAKGCPAKAGGRCRCDPGYRPRVWDASAGASGRWINGPTMRSLGEARNWRIDALRAVRSGTLRAPERMTFAEAADALVAGMRDGSWLDRSGKPFKPSTCRSYEQALRSYVKPKLGHKRLSSIRRRDVQALVDELRAAGLAPGTVLNKLDPVRVIFRRAMRDDLIAVDPTEHLDLPLNRGRRERVEPPGRANALIDALPESERAFWAMALMAGLRRGELRALRFRDVDLKGNRVHVRVGWDDVEGEIELKSDAGRRTVPLASRVRRELAAHKLRTGRGDDDLVFGRTATLPFVPTTVRSRARKAWKAAGLEPLTPHEARHCAASYLIAAGVNDKELTTYIGHSDIRTTYNVYGHLMPGNEREAAAKLDAFFGEGTGS
jgi:integrase